MEKISNEVKQKIIEQLNSKIPNLQCPMCKSRQFVIADGYFNNTIQPHINGVIIGGASIPNIGIICNHCGFISHHALGVLGLLPQK